MTSYGMMTMMSNFQNLDWRKQHEAFPLSLRIPAWTGGATAAVADGQATPAKSGEFHRIERRWTGKTNVRLKLPMALRAAREPYWERVTSDVASAWDTRRRLWRWLIAF